MQPTMKSKPVAYVLLPGGGVWCTLMHKLSTTTKHGSQVQKVQSAKTNALQAFPVVKPG